MPQEQTKTLGQDIFTPGRFKGELRDLNAMSREGWQLTARRRIGMDFQWDDTVCWRYTLGHRYRSQDETLFLHDFRSHGWEFVCSVGRWYYFRQPDDRENPAQDAPYGTESVAELIKKRVFSGCFEAYFAFSVHRLIFELKYNEFPWAAERNEFSWKSLIWPVLLFLFVVVAHLSPRMYTNVPPLCDRLLKLLGAFLFIAVLIGILFLIWP